jgi:hypothetical protein
MKLLDVCDGRLHSTSQDHTDNILSVSSVTRWLIMNGHSAVFTIINYRLSSPHFFPGRRSNAVISRSFRR